MDARDQTRSAAIEIDDLHVELGGIEILSGVNARIGRGEITALIGPNGAGKTTLLLAMLGMIPYRGRIVIARDNGLLRVSYLPQRFEFDRGLPVRVMDFLCLSQQRLPLFVVSRKQKRAKALAALGEVEAEHLRSRRLGALSGGELQRVMLASALLEDPTVLLLDEPASAVDRTGEELFMGLVRRLHQERRLTVVMVSHDLSMVTRLASQVICLNRRVLSAGKTAEVLNKSSLSSCFGEDKGLLLHDHPWDAELSCAREPEDGAGPGRSGED